MTDRIVIIGGVAGGASVATRLRRLNEDAEIVIYEAGPYISFANCGLPYYVGKKIKERDQLLVESVDDMEKDFNIEVHVSSKVTKIDSDNKQLTIQTEDGEKQDQYSKLVLSTGAQPVIPNFPEMNTADNIFTVRNVPDVDQITKFIDENQAKTATVIGGGFIGLEMVENLKERGLSVNLVEATNQVMPNFDFEMAQYLHEHLQINGINLLLNTKLVGFHNNGHQVLLNNGAVLQTDLTILAIGIRPNSQLAIDAGIQTDQRGFINTDNHFETNLSDIFAIGDVINVTNEITGARQSIPLAGPANRQGRFLADYLSGIDHTNQPILGTSVAKVFALTAASTGANERQLKQAEIDYHIIHLHPNSSAEYYPGAAPIHLKILFGEDNHILGAQAIGTTKVTKRIDIISTAIRFGATVSELADIEVSYAPPYASAKDPVNFAGYIADDIQNGLVKTFQWHEVDQLIKDGNVFLDVRNPDELLAEPKLPGAINIPRSEIRDRINELPKDRPIYVYCAVGLRGYNVSRILTQNGLDARNLDGGIKTYLTATYDSMPQDSEPERSSNALDTKTPVTKNSIELDACGLQCPGPILKVKQDGKYERR
ncbi:FAD-dependent oxidoreductase [Paucilactobacillus suebicus]|uniref:Pyridine nucleotide-disulfide oxidoreductase family protein n=1 Tax=Paucilactobacillus suebicus DSM 5007 = KCTC 3549 TaxID=1423807 RepID=A0A0R1W293_9LACO|nr:pyridine nucleotide-disulfide oxidoreductase family protein [Paucilactobacillus suebicus DSM 5007 = KCTC 3549]